MCANGEIDSVEIPGTSAETRFISGFEVPQKNAANIRKRRFIKFLLCRRRRSIIGCGEFGKQCSRCFTIAVSRLQTAF